MAGFNQQIIEGAAIAPDPDLVSDLGASDEAFWEGGDVVWPKPKERVTVRFDQDVLDFFRREGKGYQTRMNAVLRAYIRARAGAR